MYRNGYLSYNHNFNYDIDMKDLTKLNGVDVIRGTGVCRSISSFLTDLYKEMGCDSCNLLVNANRTILNNIDRQGNYSKWKISKKTSGFVKTISNVSSVIPISNHLITLLEKDRNTYVFDPTIDYETYKEIYKNTLIYIKNNISLFQEFYENNNSLYLELFQKINDQSSLISRLYPKLNFKKI